ncbi:hypothetical protein [Actinomadura rudentiformis]|uniref:Uncharacterized protein n=1 Tax=Actinomadura rudentiformis TaxID=359158 RepID=A0A6H9YVY4_9ACTN|nr:hypothetical protein [Actinomadura rudentiformis]KAB2350137.1 hypothetical protein F8566_10075 [Actinomadura rudentiformis]
MRHLTSVFASGAVGRGREIGQFLGSFDVEGRRGLRYATILPAGRFERIRVRLYEVEDLVSATVPFDEFPGFYPADDFEFTASGLPLPLDPGSRDEFGGRTVAETDSAEDALEVAERLLGARHDRWVNQGVLLDEYQDYVRQERPLGAWPEYPND